MLLIIQQNNKIHIFKGCIVALFGYHHVLGVVSMPRSYYVP
jgi:hypothetical protein